MTTWLSVVRYGSIATGLFTLSAPLIQRSFVISEETSVQSISKTLPIQIRPMWNMTANINPTLNYGKVALYQPEFFKVASQVTNRKPMTIGKGLCTGKCSTTVTIAGFDFNCTTDSKWTTDNVPVTFSARDQLAAKAPRFGATIVLGSDDSSLDEELSDSPGDVTWFYQLDIQFFNSEGADVQPEGIAVTSHVRSNTSSDKLSSTRCLLRPAYVELDLSISNTTVAIDYSTRSRYKRTLERMPRSIISDAVLAGFSQYLQNNFQGAAFFINTGPGFRISTNAQVYVNQTTIAPGLKDVKFYSSFTDPIPDVLDLVDELSLRYAMVDIPESQDRISQWQKFNQYNNTNPPPVINLKTTAAQTQKVILRQERIDRVYKPDFIFFVAAMFLFLMPVPFILVSLLSWRKIGRRVTMSPFEIAKAFDAPSLKHIACSNLTAKDIVKDSGRHRIRYGVIPVRQRHRRHSDGGQKPLFLVNEGGLSRFDSVSSLSSHAAPSEGAVGYADIPLREGEEQLRLTMTERYDAMEPVQRTVYR